MKAPSQNLIRSVHVVLGIQCYCIAVTHHHNILYIIMADTFLYINKITCKIHVLLSLRFLIAPFKCSTSDSQRNTRCWVLNVQANVWFVRVYGR